MNSITSNLDSHYHGLSIQTIELAVLANKPNKNVDEPQYRDFTNPQVSELTDQAAVISVVEEIVNSALSNLSTNDHTDVDPSNQARESTALVNEPEEGVCEFQDKDFTSSQDSNFYDLLLPVFGGNTTLIDPAVNKLFIIPNESNDRKPTIRVVEDFPKKISFPLPMVSTLDLSAIYETTQKAKEDVCSIASKAVALYKAIFADQPQSTKIIYAAVELLGAMLATKGGKALFVLGVLSFLLTSYLTFIIPFGYVAYKANLGGKAILGLLAAWFFAPITTLVGTAYVGYKLYQHRKPKEIPQLPISLPIISDLDLSTFYKPTQKAKKN